MTADHDPLCPAVVNEARALALVWGNADEQGFVDITCRCDFIARVRADERSGWETWNIEVSYDAGYEQGQLDERQRWERRAAQFMRENDPDAHDVIQWVLNEDATATQTSEAESGIAPPSPDEAYLTSVAPAGRATGHPLTADERRRAYEAGLEDAYRAVEDAFLVDPKRSGGPLGIAYANGWLAAARSIQAMSGVTKEPMTADHDPMCPWSGSLSEPDDCRQPSGWRVCDLITRVVERERRQARQRVEATPYTTTHDGHLVGESVDELADRFAAAAGGDA